MKLNTQFISVAFSEFCDRLSFYGLQSLLVIYFIHTFFLSTKAAYTVYGSFSALAFAICIVGGLISDKFLTEIQTVFWGIFFMFIGNIILAASGSLNIFYLGMTLIILGVGFIKPGASCLMGLIYKNKAKDKAFIYFYTIGSIGGIVGPVLYGVGIIYQKYWLGYAACAMILLISIILLSSHLNSPALKSERKTSWIVSGLSIFISLGVVYLILSAVISILWLIIPAALVCLFLFFRMIQPLEKAKRPALYLLAIPIGASIIFFASLLQIFSSITVFIHNFVNTQIAGFNIPVTWFSSSESIFLLIISPFIANLWSYLGKNGAYISEHAKLALGLVATAIAFFLFSFGALISHSDSSLSLIPILGGFLCFSIGELCVIPISILLITTRAPEKYKGMLMGIYYFALAASGYLAGLIAKFSPTDKHAQLGNLAHYFFLLGASVFLLTFLLVLLYRLINHYLISPS